MDWVSAPCKIVEFGDNEFLGLLTNNGIRDKFPLTGFVFCFLDLYYVITLSTSVMVD